MEFIYKKAYLKQFDRFSSQEKELVIAADKEIRAYYANRTAAYGLRIKKLYDDGGDKIFEARVSDKIRIIWVESQNLISFAISGSHDEIRKFIKDFI